MPNADINSNNWYGMPHKGYFLPWSLVDKYEWLYKDTDGTQVDLYRGGGQQH